MSGEDWVRALAPAKINPTLEILGKRPDGFHEVRTHMVCLELADEVLVREREDGEVHLQVSGPEATADIPRDESNLVWRAARGWLDMHIESSPDLVRERGVDLELVKNVPSQAGLGGGSSDAAATILACSQVLRLPFHARTFEPLLESLGSDCVFFASAAMTGAALCEGRGEKVLPRAAPKPPWHVSIVVPEVRVPTHAVYAALEFSLRAQESGHSFNSEALQLTAVDVRPWLINDLEQSALESFPELRSWRDLLDAAHFEHFRLAGSGATFFGLFNSQEEAAKATLDIEALAQANSLPLRASFVTCTADRAARLVNTERD